MATLSIAAIIAPSNTSLLAWTTLWVSFLLLTVIIRKMVVLRVYIA